MLTIWNLKRKKLLSEWNRHTILTLGIYCILDSPPTLFFLTCLFHRTFVNGLFNFRSNRLQVVARMSFFRSFVLAVNSLKCLSPIWYDILTWNVFNREHSLKRDYIILCLILLLKIKVFFIIIIYQYMHNCHNKKNF